MPGPLVTIGGEPVSLGTDSANEALEYVVGHSASRRGDLSSTGIVRRSATVSGRAGSVRRPARDGAASNWRAGAFPHAAGDFRKLAYGFLLLLAAAAVFGLLLGIERKRRHGAGQSPRLL
jgi:hypothetical protein